MTTTNNLIDQVGGIEKAKAIVAGAPEGASHTNLTPNYFKNIRYKDCEMWNPYDQNWFETDVFSFDVFISINDLRTAIALHDSQEFKVGDSIVKINNGGYSRFETEVHQVELVESERVKVFSQDKSHSYWVRLELFRHATPAEIKAGRRLDYSENVTDHVTDITNHISPNTKVINHG